MKNIESYNEYEKLFNDELVDAVRKVLMKIENRCVSELEDSEEHNALIRYFNKFGLHKKLSPSDFERWKK